MAYLTLSDDWRTNDFDGFTWTLETSCDMLGLGCTNVRPYGDYVACWRSWGHEMPHIGNLDIGIAVDWSDG